MKCPSCGAEINNNSKFCEFCGSAVTVEMLHAQEQLNKKGCPRCGSTNVTFNREKLGEVKRKGSTAVVRSTVGLCKDCGYTWNSESEKPAKRKTWLWVLGWLFVFPVPITILLLRKKDMKPALKYGIIAAAWILFLIIGLGGQSNSTEPSPTTAPTEIVTPVEVTTEPSTAPVEPPTEAATTPPTEALEETSAPSEAENETSADFQVVLDLIEGTASDNFDYFQVEGDATGVTISTAGDGIAAEILVAKASGEGKDYEPWVEVKDSMISYCNSVQDFLKTLGYEDTLVMINVLNDTNHEKVFLSLLNGVVFYDIMAE